MKVLDLTCANAHTFEGWFASDDDHASQVERGLLACPICNDKAITRLPSAPRLGASRHRADVPALPSAEAARTLAQAQWLRGMREVLKNTEDVGEKFPDEARRIHYGEAAPRGIRGRASPADAEALRDEGIEVVAVALPEALKNTVQ